jgi:hypothetical protein
MDHTCPLGLQEPWGSDVHDEERISMQLFKKDQTKHEEFYGDRVACSRHVYARVVMISELYSGTGV